MHITTERVHFEGSDGQRLSGRLDRPATQPRAYAIFAHCFTCSKDLYATKRISETLAGHGIGVLRFDFTGLGQSEGNFADATFSRDVADIVAAADWLREHHGAPALLVGHSLGGAAVLAAAHDIPDNTAVATIGAPFEPSHVAHLFADQHQALEEQGQAEVDIGGRPFTLKRGFVDDLRLHDPARVAELRRPLLVMHAPHDTVVGISNARALFMAARHPKSFLSLDQADHLLSDHADAVYAAEVLASWASRHIGATHEHPGRVPPGTSAVHVAPSGEGRLDHDVVMGVHRLRADEPTEVGGLNTGPGPYDLLLASLGACTAMTVRLYADRKGWPLVSAEVNLDHRKQGGEDHIDRTVVLHGDLDETQRVRLMQIADRCPVHRTLHGTVHVVTTLG
jgi:uncharacterized OsmC-like protein/alpha/beta superfamily hydrolase